ncbi:MAG: hypothetical protein OXF88_04180 [Rhodobacteraceae bacterium]|nr:hypothetical protein [Paracoccaceae bacterium]
MLDGTSDLVTEIGQPFPPITCQSAGFPNRLAYRSLDAGARCAIAGLFLLVLFSILTFLDSLVTQTEDR